MVLGQDFWALVLQSAESDSGSSGSPDASQVNSGVRDAGLGLEDVRG